MAKLAGGAFIALLQLGVRLSNSAYYANFSNYTGQVLYSSTNCEIEKPVFFVYTQDDALFIIIRGSQDDEDFGTDAEFTETITISVFFTQDSIMQHAMFMKIPKNTLILGMVPYIL